MDFIVMTAKIPIPDGSNETKEQLITMLDMLAEQLRATGGTCEVKTVSQDDQPPTTEIS